MAIDGEPRNGDFARYVENLTRAGGASPGQVPDKRTDSRPAAPPPPASPSETLSGAPWGKPAPPPLQSRQAPTAPGQTDAAEVSMARQATQRKIGVILTVGGILAGWAGARIIFEALRGPGFDLDEAMPAVFLFFFAMMLFKAARNARNPRNKTPLPPLKRSSYRKDGGA
ncbi:MULTISPECIES: hypothetical protein [Achromobacter]|uniref:Uncharacterized protein n=1 Tax=Alcaligenes xylosoxydans xylosoxydans TaxID=85698 RepID=A0A424WCZ4_ALCXX|nr:MULTISPECIES: hypothetical protein [Achromobacter]MBC9903375.1 hypothetical protein [Achromobacter xylosoxidans]MBD0867258.1 hypothetical protein [Achromobacter xylosoxidans]MDH1304158.1 hypothetical protein [Achromobacter sp. GD03932]QNP88286.1 hypothetical protein IAG39_12585 [Achromobacter xylosoxidans]RPJ91119.1 hypothetical protein DY367_14435 [Achromobacter xylosoxidans]